MIYLFDMDGTLTPARLPMTKDFARKFIPWLKTNKAYIATGSDFSKVEEQMPLDVINAFTGIYCSMGNVFWQKGSTIYKKDITPEKELLDDLEYFRKNTKYPYALFDNHIEKRIGMVNFSILGRNCTYNARIKYKEWDDASGERKAIQKKLQQKYLQYDFSLGGNISIDIVPKGCGKGQIAHHLREQFPRERVVFFGDRTFPSGNDYELACVLNKMDNTQVIQVENPDDVLVKLGIEGE